MTIEDCEKVLELIDKNTRWFTDGWHAEYNVPLLRKEEIEQLKREVKGLTTFEGESSCDK